MCFYVEGSSIYPRVASESSPFIVLVSCWLIGLFGPNSYAYWVSKTTTSKKLTCFWSLRPNPTHKTYTHALPESYIRVGFALFSALMWYESRPVPTEVHPALPASRCCVRGA